MMFINALGITCAAGNNAEEVRRGILAGISPGMQEAEGFLNSRLKTFVGIVEPTLPGLPFRLCKYDCRNNRLLFAVLGQIENEVSAAIERFGPDRIGIVLGTSTSGICAGEKALAILNATGEFPPGFHYLQQEIGALSECLALHLGLSGPAYTISTACSSSARAFISAKQLLSANICDAVIVGGADTLCKLTLNGFDGLELLSKGISNPLSINRDGINIGEGAALFLVSRQKSSIALLGTGDSSDSYHISAPDPEGQGAIQAMTNALVDAKLTSRDIGYLNLHGTATKLNDQMECKAVSTVLGQELPCSSTKPLTGHTLGAAGAVEAAICCLVLTQMGEMRMPPHLWDGVADPELSPIKIVSNHDVLKKKVCMSNSFAFGGNNVSLIFGGTDG